MFSLKVINTEVTFEKKENTLKVMNILHLSKIVGNKTD